MSGERIDRPCTLTIVRNGSEREVLLTPREM
jgi:hypothetical protein